MTKIERKSPSAETLKLLYVRSGNECAFPNCNHPIFNDKGLYIAELCHIRAAKPGGQRFEKSQTKKERSAQENLLFMCHRHHKETDDIEEYTIEKLTEIKTNHELKFTEKGKIASEKMINQILYESQSFWENQSYKTFKNEDLKIVLDFNTDSLNILAELENHVLWLKEYIELFNESDSSEKLQSDLKLLFKKANIDYCLLDNIPYYENPFENRNWETHHIGIPNLFSKISLNINHLKIKIIEEALKIDPKNIDLKLVLNTLRRDFDSQYENSYYID